MVVFDGYPDIPTTKDTTHIRRRSSKTGRSVNVTPLMKLNMSKESFQSVLKNKDLFNKKLVEHINKQNYGLSAIQAECDADYLVVKTAVSLSSQNEVVVISEDTDILFLLLHHANTNYQKIFLTWEAKTSCKTPPKIWDIFETKYSLGIAVCENILPVHALLGCDTTSRIHGIGKGTTLRKFEKDANFREKLSIFSKSNCSINEIAENGESIVSMLYGSSDTDDLGSMRYAIFCKKLATNTKVIVPEVLPPTSDALKWHSLRVYHQVQAWKGIALNTEEWGWICKGKFLLPKLMSQPAGPAELLKVIRCNCKTDCATSRCSCYKHNLKCSAMCGVCKGVSCLNHQDRDFENPV